MKTIAAQDCVSIIARILDKNTDTITTQRLILNILKEEELEALERITTTNEVASGLGMRLTGRMIQQMFSASAGISKIYSIRKIANDKIIGVIQLKLVNDIPDLSYFLDPQYWGHGYVSEAAISMIDEAFKNGTEKITASTFTSNIKSQNVLHRLGFKKIGLGGGPYSYFELLKGDLVK